MAQNGNKVMKFPEVQALAQPYWEMLNENQTFEYEDKASEAEIVMRERGARFTFNGLELEEFLADRLEMSTKSIDEIAKLIARSTDLDELVFHIVSTSNNTSSSGQIYPSEITIIKFSLKYGIFDEINILVKPGRFPEDLDDCCVEIQDENDYFEILNEMLKFLQPLETIPVFFADDDAKNGNETIAETAKIISHIFQQTHDDEIAPPIHVYPVSELFNILRTITIQQKWHNPPSHLFNNVHTTSGCDTHRQQEASYTCCLSKARRMCFRVVKYCCDVSRHEVKPESHHPHQNIDENLGI